MSMTPPFRSERRAYSDADAGSKKQLLRLWWQNLSIRSKTTALAIALGTIPVLSVGTLSYILSNRAIIQEIASIERTRAIESQGLINVFMRDRLIDIKTLASMEIFADADLLENSTSAERTEVIERFKEQSGDIYDSIGVFDVEGDVLAETSGVAKLDNHLNRSYIQAAKASNGAVLSDPLLSASSGIFSVYAASVIKDEDTGELVGYVRARIPVEVLGDLLQRNFDAEGTEQGVYLLDSEGQVFLGPEGAYLKAVGSDGQEMPPGSEDAELTSFTVNEIFENLNLEQSAAGEGSALHRNQKLENNPKQLVAFSGPQNLENLPDLGWGTLVSLDVSSALAPQKKLLFALVLGSIVAA